MPYAINLNHHHYPQSSDAVDVLRASISLGVSSFTFILVLKFNCFVRALPVVVVVEAEKGRDPPATSCV